MNDRLKQELKNYNLLKSNANLAFEEKKYEKALDYAHIAAKMVMQSHIGLWYDDQLEELLAKIGRNLKVDEKKNEEHKKIVYILTYLTDDKGTCLGHCQAFRQWSKILDSSPDKIYVTHCYTSYESSHTSKDINETPVHNLSRQDSYSNRIKELIKNVSQDSPDEIVLFINPDDVIAISALYALDKKPRIIFFNHADHSFWLGRNLIDTLVEFRDEGAKSSRNYRNVYNSSVVPLITKIKPKKVSKNNWGININSTVSISIGNLLKVLDGDMDYFRLIEELLLKYPDHYHVFITHHINQELIKTYFNNYDKIKNRFIIAGPVKDLSGIYGLGDFLIETYPLNGDTIRMEAMACKLPVVAYYNKKFPLAAGKDYLPSNYPFIGSTNQVLIDYCGKLIEDPQIREEMGEILYRHYLEEYTYEKISEKLINIVAGENRVIVRNDETKNDYDLGYARKILVKTKVELNKQLLFQSIFKPSKFSMKDKINFYFGAVKGSEFKSKKHAISHLFLPFVGFKGFSIGKKFGDKGISLYHGLFVK